MDWELAASNRGKPRWDSLEVSLHDGELAQEVELLAYVMVATNETEHPLSQTDVDRILGVTANGGHDRAHARDATGVDGAGSLGSIRNLRGARSSDGDAPVVPAQRRSTG